MTLKSTLPVFSKRSSRGQTAVYLFATRLPKYRHILNFLKKNVFICLHVYLCMTYVTGTFEEEQKRVLDPWELELWMVISYHVCAENEIQILCQSNRCS